MSKIAIVGDITTKPGSFDEYFELMKIHAAASRDEPGCLRFDLVVPLKGENRVLFYELYEDRPSFDAHASTDRIKAHGAKTKEMLENRTINICELKDSHEA